MAALALISINSETEAPPIVYDGINNRRSIQTAFKRAAQGLKPQQPHDNPKLLLAEAFRAQAFLKKIGPILEQKMRGSEFEIGPDKDLIRVQRKMASKSRPISDNPDFARCRQFTSTTDQMKDSIDEYGQRSVSEEGLTSVVIQHNGEEIPLYIVDVDNTFSNPNKNKPGLRNLDLKLLVPLDMKNGTQSYHICEYQFILSSMRKEWSKSHDFKDEENLQSERMDGLEEAMQDLDSDDHEAYASLLLEYNEAAEKRFQASIQREKINVVSARRSGADVLTGYQPCRNSSIINVALTKSPGYMNLVAN